MTDRAQFEAMLEALINDDQATAKEIFHNIVVGKSREIYEELLESDFGGEDDGEEKKDSNPDQGNPYGDDKSDDGEDDGEEDGEDDGEEDGEDDEEGEIEKDIDDAEDDADEIEGDDGDIEDRVMDLEDALEDLKAEFEQLLAGEEHEEHEMPGIHGAGEPDTDMAHGMGGDELEAERMMEYTIKVPNPKHGDNGTNTKSTIDNMKNDMGGTTANIAQNFSTTTGGTKGGLAKPTTEDLTSGLGEIQNRPGINKSKSFTKKEPGHGPEKKGAGEKSVSAKSTISSRVR